MEIRSLENTSLSEIVTCLTKSFEGYFVPMPSEVNFWRNRFSSARVQYHLSFGVFYGQKLIAFIINGIDSDEGQLTAFNTGTGVLPEYRGQNLVDKMYNYALPKLKEYGIQKCKLEVIDKNDRAIKVYERIGFVKTRRLKCYKGNLPEKPLKTILREINFSEINYISEFPYSWENCDAAINNSKNYSVYKIVESQDEELVEGHIVIDPETGYIAQIEAYKQNWASLFNALQNVVKTIKINNIDSNNSGLIQYLEEIGIENSINQFEMELFIKNN